SDRARWPWRWPTAAGTLAAFLGRRSYRGRNSGASSSPSIIAPMNSRTRSRTQAPIGSNQSSKKYTAVSATGCEESCFVLMLFMAWSPTRRFNVGRFEVEHPGDYATFNSNQLRDGTSNNVRTLIADQLGVDVKRVTDEAHFTDDLGADWLDRLELMIV